MRSAPRIRCDFTIDVPGPHPGCAGFGPPDTIECSHAATHLVKVRLPHGLSESIDERLRLCEFHAQRAPEFCGVFEAARVRVYRFRRL